MNKTYYVSTEKELLSERRYLKVGFTNDKNWWQKIAFKNKQEWLNFKNKIDNIHKEVLKVCKEENID